MANATATVPMTLTPWGDDKVYRDLSVATAATYYMGSMIALNASRHAVKCTDAAGLIFDGIMVGPATHVEVATTDTLGDKKVVVKRPWRFRMKIAAAALADVGSPLYALYDNEVALTGGSHSILVGWVDKVVDATTVVVRPVWAAARGVNAFDGETLTFDGATGANVIAVPDNLAEALTVSQGANDYLVFNTTDTTGEYVQFTKPLLGYSAGFIGDANKNELILFPATVASAVNEVTVSNAATGAAPSLAATGGNTNVSLNLGAKGAGVGLVRATANFAKKVTQTATTDTATITIAQIQSGCLDATPTAAADYTLPTAANLVAGIANCAVGDSIEFVINNKSAGANTVTVLAGSGGTADGTLTVAQHVVRKFQIIVTNVTGSSEAYFVYGIG
jgi:hypothetical protein